MGYFQCLRHEVVGCVILVTQLVTGPVDKMIPESLARQADLSLVAITNNLHCSWVCRYPHLTLMYVHHYLPDLCSRMVGWLGPKVVTNMRSKYGARQVPDAGGLQGVHLQPGHGQLRVQRHRQVGS